MWGNTVEDFIDTMGISLETFCTTFRGSWMFGYVDALKKSGVRTVIFCVSTQVNEPTRFTHAPTGATVCVLPAPRRYRFLRRRMQYGYGQSVEHMFGHIQGRRKLLLPILFLVKESFIYMATPHRLLAQEIRRERCNVILCQEYEYPRFDAAVVMGWMLKIPVFATFQGGTYHHARIERLLRPITMRNCQGFIIASLSELRRVGGQYDISEAKLAQIFNPIDLEQWKPCDRERARDELGIPVEARVVIWHGRISLHKKGLDVLLDAWEKLCCAIPEPDLRLVLIGSGDGDSELHSLLTSRSLRGVTWINQFFHDPAVLQHYLSAADVYAFPSRYEGFPVALVEAMACGLPVVATAIDGAQDLLTNGEKDGGVLVPPGDAAALARALELVLRDDAWRDRLGRAARQRVERTCSNEAVGKQLYSFFFKVKR